MAGALLGWRPCEFWRSTPAELAAVLQAMVPPQEPGLSRSDIERLMEAFPDG
jgi:uncharacterized phage protein (TIGR02216 family)